MKQEDVVLQVAERVLGVRVDVMTLTREGTMSWDSLTHAELIISVEEELGVRLLDDDLGRIHSIRDLVEAVSRAMPA